MTNKQQVLRLCVHWTFAILIVWQLVSSIIMIELGDREVLKWQLFSLHESIGVMVLLFIITRMLFIKQQPISISGSKSVALFHRFLIIISFLLAASGYIQAMPYGVSFFGISLPVVYEQFYISGLARIAHSYLSYVLYASLTIHILGAVRQYITNQSCQY